MVDHFESGRFDQASGLRRMGGLQPVKVVAITGGKGGVGKTLVAVNLGAALARAGSGAMLLDADLGLANVDVLLGLHARMNLEHVVNGECALDDVILTATSGLKVVPASSVRLTRSSQMCHVVSATASRSSLLKRCQAVVQSGSDKARGMPSSAGPRLGDGLKVGPQVARTREHSKGRTGRSRALGEGFANRVESLAHTC